MILLVVLNFSKGVLLPFKERHCMWLHQVHRWLLSLLWLALSCIMCRSDLLQRGRSCWVTVACVLTHNHFYNFCQTCPQIQWLRAERFLHLIHMISFAVWCLKLHSSSCCGNHCKIGPMQLNRSQPNCRHCRSSLILCAVSSLRWSQGASQHLWHV